MSIEDSYALFHQKNGTEKDREKESKSWERVLNKSKYNVNGNKQDTIEEFGKAIPSREEVYKKPTKDDQIYVYKQEYDTEEQVRKAYEKQKQKYGDRISRFTELEIVKEEKIIRRQKPNQPSKKTVYKMGVKQNGATIMMILSDVIPREQHIFGKAELDPYTRRGVEEHKFYHSVPNLGFYVAPKYYIARENFLHSGADTQAAGKIVNLGGMVDTHTPATYYLIANDSRHLITKNKSRR